MKIYWLFLILSLFICFVCNRKYKLVDINGYAEPRAYSWQAIIFFSVVIFFCGLRSGTADTGTYINMFSQWPSNINQIDWTSTFNDKGFLFLTVLYKQFISNDFHGWLFIITLISSLAIMRAFLNYSADFGMSCFLFIATTIFTYLINGMRQFIVVALMLNCIDYILNKKFLQYTISVFLLSTIHMSAIILLPFFFIYKIKPWSKSMWFIVLFLCCIGVFFNRLTFIFEVLMKDSQYEGYLDLLSNGTGTSIFRLLISLVPCIISFFGRKYIRSVNSPIINISIIMSIITSSLYFVALFTNGMVIGRILIYFEVYNLILLPWLLNNCYEEKSSRLMRFCCIVAYIVFFYIQMSITWNISYISDILGLYLY